MAGPLSRRALLIGATGAAAAVTLGGGTALVEAGVIPGRRLLHEVLGRCEVEAPLPAVEPGPLHAAGLASAAMGRRVGYALAYPPGRAVGDPLPVCLFLHGRGGTHEDLLRRDIGLPWLLATAVAATGAPFALACADAGNGYYHARADGTDAGAMLVDELLPALAADGLATGRIGLLGISMGGHGALLLGGRLGTQRVAAVGALSPALWTDASAAAAGAFDSPDDFRANDPFAVRDGLAGIPTRLDTGRDDPFADATRAFLASAPASVAGGLADGCHDAAFWRRHAGAHLALVATGLAGVAPAG